MRKPKVPKKSIKRKILGKVVPTREEAAVLKGYTYGMSAKEIGVSMNMPDEKVGRYMGNLYEKWHTLENMRRETSTSASRKIDAFRK